jgi:hypothetical protein
MHGTSHSGDGGRCRITARLAWVRGGQPTSRYRVKAMDIRVPLPKHERQGSIYEIQTVFRPKLFAGVRS